MVEEDQSSNIRCYGEIDHPIIGAVSPPGTFSVFPIGVLGIMNQEVGTPDRGSKLFQPLPMAGRW